MGQQCRRYRNGFRARIISAMQPEPFRIAVAQAEIDDLRTRLAATRLPDDRDGDDWAYGTNRRYLAGLLADWEHDYDWRAHEEAMNALPHFRVALAGQTVHYAHLARPGGVPLLLLAGWPSTFWDFSDVITRLGDVELVVPDLPGYGFSTPLRSTEKTGFVETAEMFHHLMTDVLGHDRYAVHGEDWGSMVAEQMAHAHPESVAGIHLTMPFPMNGETPAAELWSPDEAARGRHTAQWAATGTAYHAMQVTRPQTVAYLVDSPAATAGWLVEKFQSWTDHDGDHEQVYARDRILTTLSLFWFTATIGSSARFYAASYGAPWVPSRDQRPVVAVPTAIAAFPKEIAATPRKWAEGYFELVRYTDMPRGGHFAAVERPAELASDIREFLELLG